MELMKNSNSFVIADELLYGVCIDIVPLENWPAGKDDPTQYDAEKNQIQYDPKRISLDNDPAKYFVHERAHAVKKDDDTQEDYPTNRVEHYAFVTQFYQLIRAGVTLQQALKL
jgi:hypothetical protein